MKMMKVSEYLKVRYVGLYVDVSKYESTIEPVHNAAVRLLEYFCEPKSVDVPAPYYSKETYDAAIAYAESTGN